MRLHKTLASGVLAVGMLSLVGCTQSSIDIGYDNRNASVKTTEVTEASVEIVDNKEIEVDTGEFIENTKVTYEYVVTELNNQYPGITFEVSEEFYTVQDSNVSNAVFKRGLATFPSGKTFNFNITIASNGNGPDTELNETGWNISHNLTEKYLSKTYYMNDTNETDGSIELDQNERSTAESALRTANMYESKTPIKELEDTFLIESSENRVIRYNKETDVYYVYDKVDSPESIKAYKLAESVEDGVYDIIRGNKASSWFVAK